MDKRKQKNLITIVIIGLVFFGVVFGIINASNSGDGKLTQSQAKSKLSKLIKQIDVSESSPRKASIELGNTTLADELPDISKYPLTVEGHGNINLEIFVSPEKAGDGNDHWMIEVAEQFNASNISVGGKNVSVSIRNMASGLGADYIISGKYLPDAYTPSNILWGDLITSQGGKVELVKDKVVGNVAGILLSKATESKIKEKYGEVNIKTVTQATADNEIAMGYTNPLSSSTGMNFLLSTLNTYDTANILSDKAKEGFTAFQANVPYVAYTTMQMRESAKSGSLDGMVMEYQSYVHDDNLSKNYTFTPFGIRHDNPIYTVGALNTEKQEGLKLFVDFCLSNKSQELAKEYGFNQLENYKADLGAIDGYTILQAQKLWKENKDSNKSITAVFVADVSGSMSGEPLNKLKQSLINGAQYIGSKNKIGLVSYSSDVVVNLQIGEFNLNQRAYFQGAIEDLQAGGNTASYDGVAVAMNMLIKEKKANPDTKLMMFLLSDGEQNVGASLKDIRGILKAYEIPVYTIGYNANLDELQTISSVNEAASIDADSDDVIYKLKNLFNAQM